MSDSDSDVEMHSALPKKLPKQQPVTFSQELLVEKEKRVEKDPAKLTTKEMIHEALTVLHTRKGVSLYAIKKYLTENHGVDTGKMGFYIKKYLRTAVEKGILIQTKGIGVSGSFKLAPEKKSSNKIQKKSSNKIQKKSSNKIEKKIEKKPKEIEETTKSDKADAKKTKSNDKPKQSQKETDKKMKITKPTSSAPMPKEKDSKKEKVTKKEQEKPTKKAEKEKKMATGKVLSGSKMAAKITKEVEKAAEKRKSLVRRKSLGSIIKRPKMKPKSRA